MQNSVQSKAEEKFAAILKKNKLAQTEREKARRKEAEHVAKLRALRLAKEAADKEKEDDG
jgi:colicin import membrane protein